MSESVSQLYELDVERMSEASSIELVIQGGDHPQFPQNSYHHNQVLPERFNHNFMQKLPPLSSSITSNVREGDIFFEYVNNPYNTPIQYDTNSETKVNETTDSTMFQSSSYFNASETKDLLFMDPKNNSSKHELFDDQP